MGPKKGADAGDGDGEREIGGQRKEICLSGNQAWSNPSFPSLPSFLEGLGDAIFSPFPDRQPIGACFMVPPGFPEFRWAEKKDRATSGAWRLQLPAIGVASPLSLSVALSSPFCFFAKTQWAADGICPTSMAPRLGREGRHTSWLAPPGRGLGALLLRDFYCSFGGGGYHGT